MSHSIAIALIDDDLSIRQALDSLCRSVGYATACFDSAEAFLAHGKPADFACVISDIRMPGMSGIELASHLGSLQLNVPIILMTAHDAPHLVQQAFACGAKVILKKPFTADQVLDELNRTLAR